MKKLTLNLETLAVETFAVAETREGVRGAEAFLTGPANCVTVSCGDSEVRACFGF